jgi:hypothetical protein
MTAPTGKGAVTRKRYPRKEATVSSPSAAVSAPAVPVELERPKTIYVRIENPDDHERLLELKKTCRLFPGENDIIMMLGSDKSSAIRLPFRVDAHDELQRELAKILGDDCVAVK